MLEIPEIGLNFDFVTTVTLAAAVCIQLIFILGFFLRLIFHKNKQKDTGSPPVSVIICARNEEDNLFENLPIILEQDYPNFEVIVVNHQSVDDSIHILKAYAREYDHLRIIDLERNKHLKNSKKLPLTLGIKGAKNDFVLLTDADCTPSSKDWIRKMVDQSSESKPIVLGYGPYQKENGFLNKIIRFDTTQIAINYFSYAKNGLAYMGIGRNMGYTKAIFENNSGFKSHYDLQSGDDDLFIQEVAKKKNYSINFEPDCTVYSDPKKSWTTWIQQKHRHFTTAPKYRVIHKALLGTYSFSLFLVYVSFALLLIETRFWIVGCILFGVRIFLSWLINGVLFAKLKQKDLIILIPFLELFLFILMPFIYYTKQTNNKWK